jgi:hypothetical protein
MIAQVSESYSHIDFANEMHPVNIDGIVNECSYLAIYERRFYLDAGGIESSGH